MHFTMHFKSQGQVATIPPEIYSTCTFERFFQQKRHVPSHLMFAPRCNFIKIPREFNLSLVSHFWPCRSAIRILVCALVNFHQLLPTCCPDSKSGSCQLCPKFPQMCACSTDSIKHAADLTFVDSGQLATPWEIETFVRNGQKYVLSKCSKCVLWNFTRAHLRTAYWEMEMMCFSAQTLPGTMTDRQTLPFHLSPFLLSHDFFFFGPCSCCHFLPVLHYFFVLLTFIY